jgi:hypothetical protein
VVRARPDLKQLHLLRVGPAPFIGSVNASICRSSEQGSVLSPMLGNIYLHLRARPVVRDGREATPVYASGDREREDRLIVNGEIAVVNAEIGIVNGEIGERERSKRIEFETVT